MSSFVFKLIAIITMFIDHSGYVIYHNTSWMNYVGRLAFPIFAWQISIGYQKTKNVNLYMYRLIIIALISQPFYMFYMFSLGADINNIGINVIFTLLVGLICIRILDNNKYLGIILTIVLCVLAQYFNLEYGIYGIVMVVIFYLFRDNKYLLIFLQIVNLIIYCVLNNNNKIQLLSIVSILLIVFLYNGKKGKSMKYLFYSFYPLQFLVLYLINR